MKISKSKLRQIIREELKEGYSREEVNRMINAPRSGISAPPAPGGEPSGEYDLEAEDEKGRQEESYVALVNYAADKMRHLLEFGHDVATVESEVKSDVLKMVNDALEEAAETEL